MELLPGSAVCLSLFSPVTKHWSDVWVVDKLHGYEGHGAVPSSARVRARNLDGRTCLKT